jgi:hypothetical protein
VRKIIVKEVYVNPIFTHVTLVESSIGNSLPRSHPLLKYPTFFRSEAVKGIRVDDLLRCDGLPFLSRPKPLNVRIIPIKERRKGKGDRFDTWVNYTHYPHRLHSGLWVLRDVTNEAV